jgi:multiple sugar transport system substrate-binding protein
MFNSIYQIAQIPWRTLRRNFTRKQRRRGGLLVLTLSLILVACSSQIELNQSAVSVSPADETLTIWWDKGYVLEEDEAIQQVVDEWQQKSGISAELSFYTADEIAQKAQRAEQAGNPPDVLFSSRAEYPLLVWQGKLANVADVIEPVENLYSTNVIKTIRLFNNVDKQWNYYAVPLHQATIHIFYWKDLLAQAGYTPADIPTEWDEFWAFWKSVQDKLRSQNNTEVYGLGLPFSVGASDTYYLFEQVLEAYNVQILDRAGNLRIEQADVRDGIIQSLKWYTQFYQQGYVPSDALRWLDPDNNRRFINRDVVMTPNPTLSIPIALRQEPEVYLNQLGTLSFPNKPNGDPMRHIVLVRQAGIFAGSRNQSAAKEFLSYLIQPEIIENYLQSAGGRYLPVLTKLERSPFWTNTADPHISSATQLLNTGLTRSFYNIQNPAYSVVLEENIWGKTLNRIVVDQVSPEQAADEAIAQIKQIFAEWESQE